MATLTANHCHAVVTFDVERVVTTSYDGDTNYRERFALRSDDKVLAQIVWTDNGVTEFYARTGPIGAKTTRLHHSSGYAIKGNLPSRLQGRDVPRQDKIDWLQGFLVRKGYTVVGQR